MSSHQAHAPGKAPRASPPCCSACASAAACNERLLTHTSLGAKSSSHIGRARFSASSSRLPPMSTKTTVHTPARSARRCGSSSASSWRNSISGCASRAAATALCDVSTPITRAQCFASTVLASPYAEPSSTTTSSERSWVAARRRNGSVSAQTTIPSPYTRVSWLVRTWCARGMAGQRGSATMTAALSPCTAATVPTPIFFATTLSPALSEMSTSPGAWL
mmetsp:Transcript_23144/g.59477  ORF Transcript_23144/g.59477 Transcript_23144/m.59477 type:complete len:220 (-) Transcript_23144:78-737(-)